MMVLDMGKGLVGEWEKEGAQARAATGAASCRSGLEPALCPRRRVADHALIFRIMNAAAAQATSATAPNSMSTLAVVSFGFVLAPKPRRIEDGHGVAPRPDIMTPLPRLTDTGAAGAS